jgi:serine/threonine-protein kinase HipA
VEAGILQETDDRQYIFTYKDGYTGAPVCIAMPVRTEPYRSDHLFPYFFNMLSEGANRQTQSMLLHID